MPRSLFGKSALQEQRRARRIFGLSGLGRLNAEMQRGQISLASRKRIERLEQEIAIEMAKSDRGAQVAAHLGNIERYAKRGAIDKLVASLGSAGEFLQRFLDKTRKLVQKIPGKRRTQEQVAIDFLNTLGYEVIGGPKSKPPTKRAIEVAQAILAATQQGKPTSGRTTPPGQFPTMTGPPPIWQPRQDIIIDKEGTREAEARGFRPAEESTGQGASVPAAKPPAPDFSRRGESTDDQTHPPRNKQGGRRTYGGYPVDGTLLEVSSSNIYSIGFLLPAEQSLRQGIGRLLVRFIDSRGRKKGQAPSRKAGAMYEYFNVPVQVFFALMRAGSKGRKFWDRVRIRGTVSGHQYDYRLAGVTSDLYVPRKATMTPTGEFYIPRTIGVTGASRVIKSSLPKQRVNWYSKSQPNRGQPNRGQPNRGKRP